MAAEVSGGKGCEREVGPTDGGAAAERDAWFTVTIGGGALDVGGSMDSGLELFRWPLLMILNMIGTLTIL